MKRLFAVLVWALFAASAPADAAVGLDNHQGTTISARDLHFVDERGDEVTLNRYFNAGKPVIVAMAYFECPGVCTALLNGMVEGLKQLNVVPGRAFEVVVVSIDPREGRALASAKKQSYLDSYGRPDTGEGWHFLTGKEADIARMTGELGFNYERDAKTGVYLHPSALFVLTPQGVLSSTLSGVRFSKKLLRVALLDASGGRMGTFLDRVRSICSAYLPHTSWLNGPERWLAAFVIAFMMAIVALRARFKTTL